MIQQFQISLNNFKPMTKKSNRSWLWFAGAVILWLASYFVIRFIFKLENGAAGTFGDQFGAINALFTGLSFAGIIITLRLQQEELSAQRREFMTSRAMTIVYKQLELISFELSQIQRIEGMKTKNEWIYKREYDGVIALTRWEDILISSTNKVEAFENLKSGECKKDCV
ncbi:MAG TPA: hypothetical protein PKD18_09980, partial [Saprospiraceae bacterium]|nr:hypothetical protein [Saprospiraceae bacterium]